MAKPSAVAIILDRVIDAAGFPYTMPAVHALEASLAKKGIDLEDIDDAALIEARSFHRGEMFRLCRKAESLGTGRFRESLP